MFSNASFPTDETCFIPTFSTKGVRSFAKTACYLSLAQQQPHISHQRIQPQSQIIHKTVHIWPEKFCYAQQAERAFHQIKYHILILIHLLCILQFGYNNKVQRKKHAQIGCILYEHALDGTADSCILHFISGC